MLAFSGAAKTITSLSQFHPYLPYSIPWQRLRVGEGARCALWGGCPKCTGWQFWERVRTGVQGCTVCPHTVGKGILVGGCGTVVTVLTGAASAPWRQWHASHELSEIWRVLPVTHVEM